MPGPVTPPSPAAAGQPRRVTCAAGKKPRDIVCTLLSSMSLAAIYPFMVLSSIVESRQLPLPKRNQAEDASLRSLGASRPIPSPSSLAGVRSDLRVPLPASSCPASATRRPTGPGRPTGGPLSERAADAITPLVPVSCPALARGVARGQPCIRAPPEHGWPGGTDHRLVLTSRS